VQATFLTRFALCIIRASKMSSLTSSTISPSSSPSSSSSTRWSFSWSFLFFLLIFSCFFRSLLIPSFFLFQRYFFSSSSSSLYSSGNCLLQLVNETTPYEFTLHSFYRDTKFDSNCPLSEFVYSQYQNNETKYFQVFLFGLFSSIIISFYLEWKKVLTIRYFIILLIGYHLQLLQHCYMHFGQDVTFLAGNVIHHADVSRYKYGKSEFFVDATPDGVVLTIVVTVVWSIFARSIIIQLDPELRSYLDWKALLVTTGSMGLYVTSLAKYSHERWHKSATPEMSSALPFTDDYFAYQHVYVHHRTGEAFGPNPFFDPFFSVAMKLYGYLHNTFLDLTVPSTGHFIFSVFFDFVLGLFVMVGYWIILRFAKFLDRILFGQTESKGKEIKLQ
jgi:hypothetical protein